jgi:hypothetical protein
MESGKNALKGTNQVAQTAGKGWTTAFLAVFVGTLAFGIWVLWFTSWRVS